MSYLFSDIILTLLSQPDIIIDLFSCTHERLIHFPLHVIIINFSQHHWVSRANRQLTLVHEHVTFGISQTLNVKMFGIFPPFFYWHLPDDNLPQRLWNDVLALYSTIVLNFSRTIHAVRIASNKRFSIFLWMHSKSWTESDLIFLII